MPDMYDKLGDMLNDVLESGKIPADNHSKVEAENRNKPIENQNDQSIPDEKSEESGHFSFNQNKKTVVNNKKSSKKDSKNAFATTGEVIKLHKYTYNMQFPLHIQQALTTLDIAYPFVILDIKKQYRKLLKENHPDTKKAIRTSQNVENNRQVTVDEITEAYKILCTFFSIK